MRKIVLDIETKNSFAEVGNDFMKLDISVLVVYDYLTDKYLSFEQEQFSGLWQLIEQTDMIIGYNSIGFDVPILNKYYPGDLIKIKNLDLLDEIYKVMGKRVRLDMVAEGTLGEKKSGNGLEAIKWWREGEKEKVIKYCAQDVKVTKGIYEYALTNGHIKYSLAGEEKIVNLDTSNWENIEKQAINYTLPL